MPALSGTTTPSMSLLRNLEDKIAGLVEGTFGRVFRTQVRPVEIARKLAREMEEHKTVSVSRTYVPNEYVVWLSPEDRRRFEGVEDEVTDELSAYLLEHARREKLALVSRPQITFDTDERLRLGEFGIQTRLVKPPAHEGEAASQGEESHTMVYSAVKEAAPPRGPEERAQALVATRAVVSLDDRRYVLDGPRATIGRSKQAECVLPDPNVSRRHAELSRSPQGDWTIADLGSTNGIKVNGRRVASTRLSPGDRVTLGTTTFQFDIEQ